MPATIANAGVPMILVQWVGMAIALVPIIIVETLILWATIRQRYGRVLAVVALANLVTTVVGVPVAWFLSCITEIFLDAAVNWSNDPAVHAVTHAAWLHPYEDDLGWMIPLAFMVLLGPAFIISVVIEGLIARKMLEELPRRKVWSAVLRANVVSYVLLLAYCVLYMHVHYAT